MLTADVALPVPLPRPFTYSVPEEFRAQVKPGLRVQVSIRNRLVTGIVVRVGPPPEPSMALKPIATCLEVEPVLQDKDLTLAKTIADYYLCSLGEVLASMLPRGVGAPMPKRGKRASSTALAWPGLLQAESSLDPRNLTSPQSGALERILKAVSEKRSAGFLMYGVTGSGKTEIYLRAAEKAVQSGVVLMLVPEIALTPQIVLRFEARFGDAVGLWHSRLSLGERARTWNRYAEGQCRIVIGTRSALLLPLAEVRLIILDEEHEPAYRQEERPRYHAREVALMRGKLEGCPVVLGTATPSLESWQAAREGRYELLALPERADGKRPAKVRLVHRREVSRTTGEFQHLTDALQEAIKGRLVRGEQAVLFLNRRGFATFIQCRDCGHVRHCKRCDVAVVLHLSRQKLICHYCGHEYPVPEVCDQCHAHRLVPRGMGTEKVEEEVRRLFPDARIARLDTDAVSNAKAYYRVLESFAKRELDVLVGTQMIAKGLHLPEVTLVGVVNADVGLNLPDFRAAERTFQLLSQVAGRAGRGDREGEVVIQTMVPDHYALQAVATGRLEGFYEQEAAVRKMVNYPPFSHLVRIGFQGRHLSVVEAMAKETAQKCHLMTNAVEVLGPAVAPLARIRGEYRYHVLLKHESLDALHEAVRQLDVYDGGFRDGVRQVLDVDPLMVL